MEKLFLIPQQGAVFLTLLGVGIGLGAWWQLLSWVRRRMPGLGALWDGLFAMSLGASLLGVLLRWREEQLRLYALLGVLLGALIYLLGPGAWWPGWGGGCMEKNMGKTLPCSRKTPMQRRTIPFTMRRNKRTRPEKPPSPVAPASPKLPE